MELTPGQYRGKITSYGIGETKAKDPQMVIGFEIFDLGELTLEDVDAGATLPDLPSNKLTWFGSFKEGQAREITIETLRKLGFDGDFGLLADGIEGGALNVEKMYALSVTENTWEGKTTLRISSVYIPGEQGPGMKLLSKGDAQSKLKGLGLEGDFKKMTASNGPANASKVDEAKKKMEEAKKGGVKPKF